MSLSPSELPVCLVMSLCCMFSDACHCVVCLGMLVSLFNCTVKPACHCVVCLGMLVTVLYV